MTDDLSDDDDVLREMGAAVRDFRTSGPNCHWCYHRPTAYVWCPYSTLIGDVDAWRGREHDNIRRWLDVRTHAHRVDGEPYTDERDVETF